MLLEEREALLAIFSISKKLNDRRRLSAFHATHCVIIFMFIAFRH
jgi:hypothetical protein